MQNLSNQWDLNIYVSPFPYSLMMILTVVILFSDLNFLFSTSSLFVQQDNEVAFDLLDRK